MPLLSALAVLLPSATVAPPSGFPLPAAVTLPCSVPLLANFVQAG